MQAASHSRASHGYAHWTRAPRPRAFDSAFIPIDSHSTCSSTTHGVKHVKTCHVMIDDEIIVIGRFASACLCERDVPDGTDAHPRHITPSAVVCAVSSEVGMPTRKMMRAIV